MITNAAIIAAAIFIAEGGTNARVPYGILSVRVRNEAEARAVCERTVVNTRKRWEAAGRKGCFYDFLGDRYVGRNDPVGQVNWKRNIRTLLKHQRCICGRYT